MKLEKQKRNDFDIWLNENGAIYSIIPVPKNLCYHFCLPETFYQTILQLGSCGNSLRYLIKQKYPDTILTDVDIEDYSEYSDNFIQEDAYSFIKTTVNQYDYSIVDLATTDDVCDFITELDFQLNLKRISKQGVINCGSNYKDFSLLKCTKKIKAEGNHLYFWER